MLIYAFFFLVIALIAAALGFGGVAGIAISLARVFFFLFLVIFVVVLFFAVMAPMVGVTSHRFVW